MGDQTQWRFSVLQKDGRLFVETRHGEIMFEGWPTLRAWQRGRPTADWKEFVPYVDFLTGAVAPWAFLQIGLPLERLRRRALGHALPFSYALNVWDDLAPVRNYFANVPEELSGLVTPFVYRQWQLLEFLKSGGAPAIELMNSNRGVAFAIALNSLFLPARLESNELRCLLDNDFTQILNKLGFPATQEAVQIMKEVPYDVCTTKVFRRLRSWLRDPVISKTLAGALPWNLGLCEVINSPYYQAISAKFLGELGRLGSCESLEVSKQLRESCDACKSLYDAPPPVRSIMGIAELERFSREAKKALKQARQEAFLRLAFPEPPLQGVPLISPIRTPRELLEESMELHNDAFDDARSVASGEAYFYRFSGQERTTIRVEQTTGLLRVSEVLGREGRPVAGETFETIRRWFESAKISI